MKERERLIMKSVGIICECNPFHGGHEYLIKRARESGAGMIVAVMSGCFVQRGEAAVAVPFLRAEALLRGGADLVLELPFPYAASSAEFFARAGVDILTRLGVDELWFGSECGDIEKLLRFSLLAESEEFQTRYEQSVREDRGTAQAYFETLCSLEDGEVPFKSNDILALSYLRAIRMCGSQIKPLTVKREGSAYLEELLSDNSFPSATALRRRWREEGVESILPFLPTACRSVYAKAGVPADLKYAERLILGHFRLTPLEQSERIAELRGGLGSRIVQAARKANSLEELLRLSSTKKYPMSRLRRGILFALTGVEQAYLRTLPAYTRLLAANGIGCRFLSECRNDAAIPVVTRRTDLPNTPEANAQEILEARAWGLYTLCMPQPVACDGMWRFHPIMDN